MPTSTTHPHSAASDSLQTTLQIARKSKRLSQLELALRMGVSQRHVSFVESGRAQPSRELLLNWLHELQAPLALRNVALQQAGFAPVYRGSELAAPDGTGAHHPVCHPVRRAGFLQHVFHLRHPARHHTGVTAGGACVPGG